MVNLLDTSTVLWTLTAPARLSPQAREAVAAGGSVLSVASYWEVVIRTRKGLVADSRSGELVDADHGAVRRILPIRASDLAVNGYQWQPFRHSLCDLAAARHDPKIRAWVIKKPTRPSPATSIGNAAASSGNGQG